MRCVKIYQVSIDDSFFEPCTYLNTEFAKLLLVVGVNSMYLFIVNKTGRYRRIINKLIGAKIVNIGGKIIISTA